MNPYLTGTCVLGAMADAKGDWSKALAKRPLPAVTARQVIAEVVRRQGHIPGNRGFMRELVTIDESIARSGRALIPDGAATVLAEAVARATAGGEAKPTAEVLGAAPDYGQVLEAAEHWSPPTIANARQVLEATSRLLDACRRLVGATGGAGVSWLFALPPVDAFDKKKSAVAGTLLALEAIEKQHGPKAAVPSDTVREVVMDSLRLCLQVIKETDDESAKQALAALVDFIASVPGAVLKPLSTAAKWAIGGAVVLGLGLIYAVAKTFQSPAGRAVTRHYLGGRR